MPTMTYSLSSFSRLNTDMPAGQTFTANASGTAVANARVTSGTLYLSSIRTYSASCYLTFTLGSGSGQTANLSNNSATHSQTPSLTSYNNNLLSAGSGTITFTVQRSVSGSGNLLNLRDGITGTLTLNYELNPTACGSPTSCSVNTTLSEGNVTLSWSGATAGTNNAISAYEIQYSESSDNATWGAWTALSTVNSTATSGTLSVAPPSTRGHYRRFQVRTRGAAGASYYSGWRVSSNSVRRNTAPTAPTTLSASPTPYWNQDITLSWSGAVAGTSAIASYTIQHCTSTDGTTWGAWAALATVTSTATSGSRVVTPTTTLGTYTKYRISVTDALGVVSGFRESNSIRSFVSACGAPTACSVSATLSEGNVTLSWSGAAAGTNNAISAYEIQYSESSDNTNWGAWTALSTVNSTTTSGTLSVAPPSTRGYYRRFQVRTRGAAGASYYSGWRVSTNSVRRNTAPTVPTTLTASPTPYWNQDITLSWSGTVAGTSAISKYDIQHCTSTDGSTWGAWAALATVTSSATSGSRVVTPSQTQGTYTKYRISVTDALGVASAFRESNSVRCAITACGAPTACSVSATVAEGNVTLSWSGAAAGSGNTISAYEIQYSDSTDNAAWGAWTALTVVNSTSASGSLSVSPPDTRGSYRRYQVRTRGSAGASYYSSWRVSSNSVRKNTLPSPPTTFTALPEVYAVNNITLTWSGIVAGTSAIAQTVIQVSTSVNGGAWSAYESLATITGTATSGSRAATPSNETGVLTRYRICVVDALGGMSAYTVSNTVRKLSPPLPPTIIAPQGGRTTYNTRPRLLLRTGDASTQMQAVCVQTAAGTWEDSANNTARFSPSGYLPENARVIYRHPETTPGSKSVSVRAFAQNGGVPGAEVSRSFTVASSPFEEITANETTVKAAHIQTLRTAVNVVRSYYGLAAMVWAEEVVAGRTPIMHWTFHILELREATEQVIELINSHVPNSTLGVSVPTWLPPAPGRPKAAVMLQLQNILLDL